MFCFGCYDFQDRKAMSKCEKCNMYFCEECYLEHVTDPDPQWCHPRFPPEPPKKIPRIKRKLNKTKNKNLTTDLCDFCHREFLTCDLIKGEEPFASEVYGSGQYCQLCRRCYEESLADV